MSFVYTSPFSDPYINLKTFPVFNSEEFSNSQIFFKLELGMKLWYDICNSYFLSSSVVEQSAVNRLVVGSSPTWGV